MEITIAKIGEEFKTMKVAEGVGTIDLGFWGIDGIMLIKNKTDK